MVVNYNRELAYMVKQFIQKIKSENKGFTLVELLVVIAIFLVITGVILFNSNNFDSTITASNLAQDVALSVRKADAYTLGFQTPSVSSATTVRGYGINFVAGLGTSFLIFGETPPYDQHYTHSGVICGPFSSSEECLEQSNISSRDRISQISVENGSSTTVLSPGDALSIIFIKPTGEVSFCVQTGGFGSCAITTVTVAHITITSAHGKVYTVNVWNNGQINVQ